MSIGVGLKEEDMKKEESIKEKKTVNVPLWAGIAVLVAGVVLLAAPVKK